MSWGARSAAGALALAAVSGACGVAAADAPPPAYARGAATFQANCAVCHGPRGAGLPSLAPPLTSYPARYAASREGRRQLAMTVLYGMFGDISVDQRHYDFQMPSFAQFDDATLAATLNYVVFELDRAAPAVSPLTPAEVAAERGHQLDGAAVRAHRKSVAPPAP